MKKNDSIELKIEDMGVDGEGIGKYEGMTFFVKDAVIGDTIRAGITKLKKNYGYARVQEILGLTVCSRSVRCMRAAAAARSRRWTIGSSFAISRKRCAAI